MLLGRGWSVPRLALELDLAVMEMIKPRPVRRVKHHGIRQQIAHVLHHPELRKFIER